MTIGLIGKKIGMTREFFDLGISVPVTVLSVEKGRILDVITKEKRGYDAIKVGFGSRNLQSTSYLYNTPISENISLRITGSDLKQQGHVLNTETGQMWGEKICRIIEFN